MRSETRELNCKLGPIELDQRRQDCVRAASSVQDREREKKHVTARYGQALKEAQEKLAGLIKTCETGEEVKPVVCLWEPDYPAGIARLLRRDTMDEVDVRTLTESERQQQLQLDEAAAKRGEIADEDVPGMPADDVLAEGDGIEAARLEEAPFDDDGNEEDADLDAETPPDPSFVAEALEGADAFEKNGTARVSPDAASDFGAAIAEATK